MAVSEIVGPDRAAGQPSYQDMLQDAASRAGAAKDPDRGIDR